MAVGLDDLGINLRKEKKGGGEGRKGRQKKREREKANYVLPGLEGCVDHNKQWKTLKEMGISDHLTCLLRNLYAGQEAIVKTLYGTTD